MGNKNKFVAFFLGLILGPLGFIFLGWRHAIMTFIAVIIFVLVFGLINIPLFEWSRLITLPILGYSAFITAGKINMFIELNEEDDSLDLNVLRSFSFAIYQASGLLQALALGYGFIYGVYASIIAFQDNFFYGLLVLFLGMPALMWILYMVFAFIGTILEVPFTKRISREMDKD